MIAITVIITYNNYLLLSRKRCWEVPNFCCSGLWDGQKELTRVI